MVWLLHPMDVETSQKKVRIRGDTLLAVALPKLRATGGRAFSVVDFCLLYLAPDCFSAFYV